MAKKKSKAQRIANGGIRHAGGRQIFGAPRGATRFSAVGAVKKLKKKHKG